MINPIKHFALTNWASVHDEEALTALELQARTTAKVNEAITAINAQIDVINTMLEKMPGLAEKTINQAIQDGTLRDLINYDILASVGVDLERLENRLENIIAPEGEATLAEVVDARISAGGSSFPSLGNHIRNLDNGSAFTDAVRPGTVQAGRIMAGMLGGSIRDTYTMRETIPMPGHWSADRGYYPIDTMEFVGHSGYAVTDKIPCSYGDTFLLTSYIYGPLVYPAVCFNSSGSVVAVLGKPGAGNWDARSEEIHIGRGDITHISFICGTSNLSDFRVVRVAMKQAPDQATLNASGYLRMRAKVRTDTVTDRAQIKMWFKLPMSHNADMIYQVPAQLSSFYNISGWTMRIFAATSETTYDQQMATSAAAYSYPVNYGLCPTFSLPVETAEGNPITHVCIFLDFLPVDSANFMEATLMIPRLSYGGTWTSEAINTVLHGALATDNLNIVRPGAAGSPLYRKSILGMGDSLMSGNTLQKDYSWFNIATGSCDMVKYNASANGIPVGGSGDTMASRINAALSIMPNPDYFILTGGANDKRLNVPISTFKLAIAGIIGAVRASSPRCKILMGTNWRRTETANSLGLYDSDYVAAMMEVAEAMGIPCVNNYAAGINLLDPTLIPWADEGYVTAGVANIHFSKEANRQIAEKYIRELELI